MSISLFRVGSILHYRFQIDGKRVQRTTGERVRTRARRVAEDAYREQLLWSRGGRLVPTLRELVALWLRAHQLTASRSHLRGVEAFGRLHLFALCDVPVDQLSTASVEAARNQYLATHAPISANHWLRTMRLLCHWAVHRGTIPAVPFKVKMLTVQRKVRATLPVALTAAWLQAIDRQAAEPVRIAVRLMLAMGLRESEAASARWEWIDAARQTYTPGITKGREAEPIPMPPWLVDYLRPFRRATGLIASRADGRAYGRGFTRQPIMSASQAIGIGHITPHRLRGTFATLLSENGTPIQAIQKVMRHKSPLTTIGYLEPDMQRVAAAQDKIALQYGLT
ncbi:tyrosine-type recombinase/integrase [Pandoraea sp.]|uniref:tyrosine-type recombinase/integrase n=1 Tax=Pandoraea sp. TaxID=1883445 RepID=UPI0035AFCA31